MDGIATKLEEKRVIHQIREIRKLDWSTYPVTEIESLINKFNEVPFMVTDYEAGKLIHRARPIEDGEIVNTIEGLSYKPQEKNHTFQRASSPNQTAFYGAVIPEDLDTEDLDNPRVTSAMEVIEFLRNPKLDGKKRLLYGKWKVTSKISLITILFTRYRSAKNSWIRHISEEFFNGISQYSPKEQKRYKQINNSLSDEFSKFVREGDNHKYLMSAVFSERIANSGFDGVLYPSVRTQGFGLNVSIKPESVDEKMELVSVLECEANKKGKNVVINNLSFCKVPTGIKTFHLQEITDPSYRFSDEEIQFKLNKFT